MLSQDWHRAVALHLLARGRPLSALRVLEKAERHHELNPDEADAMALLAPLARSVAYLQLELPERALTELDQLGPSASPLSWELYLRAHACAKMGAPGPALVLLEAIPAEALAPWVALARADFDPVGTRLSNRAALLTDALSQRPLAPALHSSLASAYARSSDWSPALSHASAAAWLDDEHSAHWMHLGWVALFAEEEIVAEDAFLRTRSRQPDSAAPLVALALTSVRRGLFDRARQFAREALEVEPDCREAAAVLRRSETLRNGKTPCRRQDLTLDPELRERARAEVHGAYVCIPRPEELLP